MINIDAKRVRKSATSVSNGTPGPAAPALSSSRVIPNNPLRGATYYEGEAHVLQKHGRLAEAEAVIRQAIRLKPREYRYQFLLGDYLRRQKKFAAAETALKRGLSLGRSQEGDRFHHSTILTQIGDLQRLQGKSDEAEVSYREALRIRNACGRRQCP